VRITLTIDDRVLSEARRHADEQSQSLGSYIEDALLSYLASGKTRRPLKRVMLPTAGGGSINPEVDINSNASMFSFLDREDVTAWSSSTSPS
jgi:hypothetical protein